MGQELRHSLTAYGNGATRGCFWTGYQFEEDVLWPLEKPTWTSGAVLLAADALSQYTRASRLFTDVDSREQPKLERRHLQA